MQVTQGVRMNKKIEITTLSKSLLASSLIAFGFQSSVNAADYTSNAAGDWSGGTTWSPAAPIPDTGGTAAGADNVIIDGHAITMTLATFPGTGDATVRNGNSITIRNGGSLEQLSDPQHIRIGDGGGAVSGIGTLNIEDGTFDLGAAAAVQMGIRGGTANINVGDGVGATGTAIFDGDGGEFRFGSVSNGGPAGNANLVVETDGTVNNGHFRLAQQGGTHTAVVNGNGSINTANFNSTTVGDNIGEAGTGTVTLNNNAVFTSNALAGLRIGNNGGSTGTLTLNDNSSLSLTRNQNSSGQPLGVGYAGSGTLNINDNASINATTQIFVGRDASGRGTVNQNGGSVYAQYPIGLARISGSEGVYILTDGTVSTPERFDIGHDGDGTFTQNGGIASAPTVRFGPSATGNGTWNLNGGTLRTDNIDMNIAGTGALNWGGGTLTMHEVNSGNDGTTEFSTAPIIGENVRSGTTIVVDGDLTTGVGGSTSVLDLGVLYKNFGTRQDILTLTGILDLDDLDTISAIGGANLLRPEGGLVDYGTIPLITAAGGITGTFDSFSPIGSASSFNFFESPFSVSDPSLLKPNSFHFETTGTQLLFHYKVTGAVPEPSTISFLAIGLVFLRFMRWSFKGNSKK